MREAVETGPRRTATPAGAVAEDLVVDGGPTGSVRVRLVRPARAVGPLPVIVYAHGLGWVGGALATHDVLIRRISTGVGAGVVFPDYDLAPEHAFPTQVEQVYAVTEWAARNGQLRGLDGARTAIAGDGAGGSIAAATAALAASRGGPSLSGQVLLHPASPLRMPTADARLPATLVVRGPGDAAGAAGDAYAAAVRRTGAPAQSVPSRGVGRDSVGVGPLRHPLASEEDVARAVAFLREVLDTG